MSFPGGDICARANLQGDCGRISRACRGIIKCFIDLVDSEKDFKKLIKIQEIFINMLKSKDRLDH